MTRPEIRDRASVQVLLHDGRTDVRRSCYGSGIPEPIADETHHGRDATLRLGRRLGRPALCECDRGKQRSAPCTEILRSEFLTHLALDVVVERARGQVRVAVAGLVP